jgi:hypothetical protein
LSDEVAYRLTDLHHALSVAVDDAVERRLRELDAHIAEVDAAAAEDAAGRARRRAKAQQDRDEVRQKLKKADEVLSRAAALSPAPKEQS